MDGGSIRKPSNKVLTPSGEGPKAQAPPKDAEFSCEPVLSAPDRSYGDRHLSQGQVQRQRMTNAGGAGEESNRPPSPFHGVQGMATADAENVEAIGKAQGRKYPKAPAMK